MSAVGLLTSRSELRELWLHSDAVRRLVNMRVRAVEHHITKCELESDPPKTPKSARIMSCNARQDYKDASLR